MSGTADLEQILRSILHTLPEAQLSPLARRLEALLAGSATPEILRERLLADAELAPLLAALAGKQIHAGSSVIDFGAGSQVGDVAIRDVAGGNIVTLNVYYDTPRAAPAVPPPPDNLTRRLRVFLCHASSDKPAVRQLYARLQADGFAPWLDEEDLIPGQDWRREIPKAVRTTDVVVVCLSPTAVTKAGYVQKEIGFALDIAEQQPEDAIFIIPLRLEVCDVPERLSRWQWVDSFEPGGYERLVRALRIRANQLALVAEPPQTEASKPEPIAAPELPRPSPTPPAVDIAMLWRQAQAAYLMKQWPQAVILLAQVAELDPSYRDVQARLSEARRQLALLELYQDLCALRDDDHWHAVLDGLAELEQRQPAYPDPQGLRAWAERRRQREQHFDAALAAADRGDWPLAIAELQALLAVVPGDKEAAEMLAYARVEHGHQSIPKDRLQTSFDLIEAGNFATGLDLLTDILVETPYNPEATTLTARIIEIPSAPFALRLRAAKLAGKMGDPRYPVEPAQWKAELVRRGAEFGKPAGYWCYVPAGRYQVGGWEPKQRSATIQLPAFWIARYPITVAQYAPFVDQGYGAGPQHWWTPDGWEWKRDRAEPWGWGRLEYSGDNQPVIGVTWYEATAFCAWLTGQLQRKFSAGYVVRLPTEAEWEVAAAYDASGQRRPYPWGKDEPTPEREIYDASKLDRPAPVGCCPAGAAACGALDLAGNVWEWTASSFEGYPARSNVPIHDFTSGVHDVPLRGGPYYQNSADVRSGARFRYFPVLDFKVRCGFRVVVFPP